MTRWDYRVVEQGDAHDGPQWQVMEPFGGGYKVERQDSFFAPLLASLGAEGWELAIVDTNAAGQPVRYYFKRPR